MTTGLSKNPTIPQGGVSIHGITSIAEIWGEEKLQLARGNNWGEEEEGFVVPLNSSEGLIESGVVDGCVFVVTLIFVVVVHACFACSGSS